MNYGMISKYKMNNQVHEKGYRNQPLTDEQKASNTEKSKTRARVEHVFGFMEQSINGLIIRFVGIKRASRHTGLLNSSGNNPSSSFKKSPNSLVVFIPGLCRE